MHQRAANAIGHCSRWAKPSGKLCLLATNSFVLVPTLFATPHAHFTAARSWPLSDWILSCGVCSMVEHETQSGSCGSRGSNTTFSPALWSATRASCLHRTLNSDNFTDLLKHPAPSLLVLQLVRAKMGVSHASKTNFCPYR